MGEGGIYVEYIGFFLFTEYADLRVCDIFKFTIQTEIKMSISSRGQGIF